jgi:alkylresorcinol/alkylpyrone synthase
VLVVAAESMSSILMPAGEQDSRAKTIGSAIFGDGCAAALLSDDPLDGGPTIRASQTHQLPGTLDAVRLTLEPHDSYLQLARELPDVAAAGLAKLVDEFLALRHLGRAAVDHWIVHPGGRRIIEQVQAALALSDEDVQESWRALAGHGNVGTPSIFYVLGEVMRVRAPAPGERGLLVTIGPGVTVGLMLLEW